MMPTHEIVFTEGLKLGILMGASGVLFFVLAYWAFRKWVEQREE